MEVDLQSAALPLGEGAGDRYFRYIRHFHGTT
jgi:hypothetical protein